VNSFLISLLSALVGTNQPVAVSNLVARTTGISVTAPKPNDPVEEEYQKLLETDDAAQEDVDKWIRDETVFREQGAGLPDATLRARIEQRFKAVRDTYDNFLSWHPDHARAHLAYGSFLMETHHEEEAVNQMEKARELDPKNPGYFPGGVVQITASAGGASRRGLGITALFSGPSGAGTAKAQTVPERMAKTP